MDEEAPKKEVNFNFEQDSKHGKQVLYEDFP